MAERAAGWYVYCVVHGDDRPPPDGLVGVDGAAVGAIDEGGLRAWASAVALDVFGEAPLRRNLEDIRWVERTARAHDAVIGHALGGAAVLPLRMCTVFVDADHVRAHLRRDRAALGAALRRLRGHAEWSVKVRADLRRLEQRVGGAAAPEPARAGQEAGAGRAFFERKRADRGVRQRTLAHATGIADEVHARLGAEATAATLLAPQRPELSGRPGTMLLNGAYLVAREREPAFSAAVGDLAARHRAAGVELDVSGPWAPYNFASTGEPGDERRASAPGRAAA